MIDRIREHQIDRHPRIEFEEVDISSDPELVDKYEYSLPVVLVNDKVVSELKLDGRAIRQAIETLG